MKGKKGYKIVVNGTKYRVYCSKVLVEKATKEDSGLGIKMHIRVIRMHDNAELPWDVLKKSYLAEKISEFVYNTLNGQPTFFPKW